MFSCVFCNSLFFFQAEDGIRDYKVTGVQTCALPIWRRAQRGAQGARAPVEHHGRVPGTARRRHRAPARGDVEPGAEIGRASCRERVENWVVAEGVEITDSVRRSVEWERNEA